MQEHSIHLKKYSYIDILRGIAILGVIAVHSHQRIRGLSKFISWIFNYGQLGVQLFFVASAMTLCLSMNRRNENSPYNFYVRRIFRIAPLYYFGIALYLIWGTLKTYYISGQISIPSQYNTFGIFANILFVHGFYPSVNNNVVPGGWSIATEMTFYAIFPILYWIQSKTTNKKFLSYAVISISICFLVELIINCLFNRSTDNTNFIYFSILNQLSVFIIGIYAYRLLNKPRIGLTGTVIGVVFSVISCFLLNGEFRSGFNGFIIPILSSMSFLVLAINLSNLDKLDNLLSNALKKIGEVSFSMYILHFLFLDLIDFLFKKSIFNFIKTPEIQLSILFSAVVITTYLFSTISRKFIENPGINFGKIFLKKNFELP